jgi:hypothetical protein
VVSLRDLLVGLLDDLLACHFVFAKI